MKVELEPEETRELLGVIVDRLIEEAGFSDSDRATLRRWRSDSMRPGSEGMRELTAKINAEVARILQTKSKSAVVRPDWR
jgi:Arc/MetJ family transcription regulator